ncbi:Peptidase propeptide and YPEB domain-containing protein [Salinibacillus kushneri]|uniref:Peptidase propeptide and YPEB domain-containing protein n=1 Tax=Salinibacillus kushneri TaxID=237682 RepID=A0A1I0BAA6_9BACI|nr:PepSY domain-containing protein [Salinibacillus kushneri]SET03022.1 Peptidase propeptide and YPEB domain-containing protein [Salinibacillus kushneri]
MKKKVLVSIIAMVVAFSVGMVIYQMSKTSSAASLSIEEARDIAKSQFQGEVIEIGLEKDGNRVVYEMEMKGDRHEYELVLDGETGEVIRLEQKASAKVEKKSASKESSEEADDTKKENSTENTDEDANSETSQTNKSKQQNNDNDERKRVKTDNPSEQENDNHHSTAEKADDDVKAVRFEQPKKQKLPIIQDQAIQIAQSEITFDGRVEEVELDDDGRLYYDIKMVSATHEAEIEIDAYTGAILSISTEREDD